LACLAPGSATAALSFIPCADAAGFSCSSLGVPLDRSGAVPGTISLSVERRLAGPQPSPSAMVALAGGPGQSALPFAGFTAKAMAAGLKTRDLLVFDQRGTGSSDPLSCPALEGASFAAIGRIYQRCAEQIGPARRAFTTQETVRDIEALRQAAGYQKLVLYGTSYGTKVALEYAERYPEHVEALLLDSVVPTSGPEPLGVPTLEAVAPVIRELCSQLLCAGITADPLADLTRLTARLRKRSLKGSVYDGIGRRHTTRLREFGLLRILEDGDLNPALRALVPAAVHSALHGDPDPLLRLQALAEGLIPNVPSAQRVHYGGDEIDEALYAVTTCEEAPFPWQRSASSSTRDTEAVAFAQAQPASVFAPFDATTALTDSTIQLCDRWPDASPPPPVQAPLPDVPTLILSGEQDLRTPTSNAREVAALIPDAQVLTVPFTGHSVVGSDLTNCAAAAIAAFFAGAPVAPCSSSKDVLPPPPVAPTSLSALRSPAGLPGRAGRTVVAVLDTLHDLGRQVLAATIQAGSKLPNGASFGGLRGGYTRLSASRVTLRSFAFIAGVQLTGTFQVHKGRLLTSNIAVGGPSAAAGFIRFGSAAKRVTGVLGGRAFELSLAKVKVASVGGGEWPAALPELSALGREPLAP
jgi:pimeloyl-ACP methyl ester carboxylesterase